METLDRGRAGSTFPGEIIFRMTSFVLILFPVRIVLERTTAPSMQFPLSKIVCSSRTVELELELIQNHMTQKPMLRVEVGGVSIRATDFSLLCKEF